MKLKGYWFAGVTVACAVPLAVLIFHGLQDNTQLQRQELAFEQSLVSEVSMKLRDRLINAKKVISLSADFLGNNGTKDLLSLQIFLKNLYTTYNEFLNVHFDSLDGKVLAFYPPLSESGQPNIGLDHTDRKHWKALQENNTPHISGIFQGVGATSKVIANVTSGAFDSSGRLVGYAVSALDLEILSGQFTDMKLPKGYVIVVTDGDGKTVFTSSSVMAPKGAILSKDAMSRAKKSEEGIWTNVQGVNGESFSGLVCDIPQIGWYIGLFHKPLSGFSHIKNQYVAGLLSVLLAILLSTLISYLTYRPIGNSLKKLIDQARSNSNSSPKEKIESPEEFAFIQQALTRTSFKTPCEVISKEDEEKKQRPLMVKYIKLQDLNQALSESMTMDGVGYLVSNDYAIIEHINQTFNDITGYNLVKGGKFDYRLIEELRGANLKRTAKQNYVLYTFPETGIYACCRLISVGKDPTRFLFTVRRITKSNCAPDRSENDENMINLSML